MKAITKSKLYFPVGSLYNKKYIEAKCENHFGLTLHTWGTVCF